MDLPELKALEDADLIKEVESGDCLAAVALSERVRALRAVAKTAADLVGEPDNGSGRVSGYGIHSVQEALKELIIN
jgi:hypothetical protein